MTHLKWHYLAVDRDEEDSGGISQARRRAVNAISGRARVRMLSRTDEAALARAWTEAGDQDSLTRLLTAHDPLILTMAQRLARRSRLHDHFEDLYQAGQEAFIECLRRYRADNGNRLASFAKYSVFSAMHRHVLDFRLPMRTGTSVAERRSYARYHAVSDAFEYFHGRALGDAPADIAEAAAAIEAAPAAFKRARRTHIAQTVPIDRIDIWDPTDSPERPETVIQLLAREFTDLAGTMCDRDVAIARAFLCAPDRRGAADAAAMRFGLTPERVRQIVRHALGCIRASLAAKELGSVGAVLRAD